jgi:hypothetical protein
MNSSIRRLAVLVALGVPALGWLGAPEARAQNINELINETQQLSSRAQSMRLVWWIPTEYWAFSAQVDPKVSAAQMDSVAELLRPFTVIAAVDGELSPAGEISFLPAQKLRASIRLVDSHGTRYPPIAPDAIPERTQVIIDVLKPLFANLLGQMGESMEFFLFPAADAHGHPIAPATGSGGFSVVLAEEEFRWRLPLGSLVPRKRCPVDGELLSGSWRYCPWHGVELVAAGTADHDH